MENWYNDMMNALPYSLFLIYLGTKGEGLPRGSGCGIVCILYLRHTDESPPQALHDPNVEHIKHTGRCRNEKVLGSCRAS